MNYEKNMTRLRFGHCVPRAGGRGGLEADDVCIVQAPAKTGPGLLVSMGKVLEVAEKVGVHSVVLGKI